MELQKDNLKPRTHETRDRRKTLGKVNEHEDEDEEKRNGPRVELNINILFVFQGNLLSPCHDGRRKEEIGGKVQENTKIGMYVCEYEN